VHKDLLTESGQENGYLWRFHLARSIGLALKSERRLRTISAFYLTTQKSDVNPEVMQSIMRFNRTFTLT
jgi:hypothetical protein